jgi:predicted nucleic acid-binding protein
LISEAKPFAWMIIVSQLAKEIGADILLTDDRKARAVAVSLEVRCTGLLGLLVLAKQANHLDSVRIMIEAGGGRPFYIVAWATPPAVGVY